jgi:hypothetical protein
MMEAVCSFETFLSPHRRPATCVAMHRSCTALPQRRLATGELTGRSSVPGKGRACSAYLHSVWNLPSQPIKAVGALSCPCLRSSASRPRAPRAEWTGRAIDISHNPPPARATTTLGSRSAASICHLCRRHKPDGFTSQRTNEDVETRHLMCAEITLTFENCEATNFMEQSPT